MHSTITRITQRIIERSRDCRDDYLSRMKQAEEKSVHRAVLACGNLAHGFAACNPSDKSALKMTNAVNVGIISAYNDMLSAHQPFQYYPEIFKKTAQQMGSVAQFAGGVPAMCDGVTQGQPGMELSLFSRDTIAMSSAIGLSHNMFDAAAYLGVCDKIVPGLLIGALSFGHLPTIFVPAGPMPSGLPNKEKARIRQMYAEGKVDREALLKCESDSYHSAGTCTFYGTANSNQLIVELMGLHLPGSSFINPGSEMRDALTSEACRRAIKMTPQNGGFTPLYEIVTEYSMVNAVVALLATGGSTNHTMHLIAIARAAGIIINWDDFSELSAVVPLVTRIYPNGQADINHFQAAGGTSYLVKTLLEGGLLHENVKTVMGEGLSFYTREPFLENGKIVWREGPEKSLDSAVLTSFDQPFSAEGGVKLLKGNLGRAVIKVSAVDPQHQVVSAPAVVFDDQNQIEGLFKKGLLDKDFVAVVRFQGPKSNGMPELHKLTPFLGSLQDRGFKVALVTDGRMSGASGKVPAAIHLWPEALDGGLLAKVQDGDMIHVNALTGELSVDVPAPVLAARTPAICDLKRSATGMGRELFAPLRSQVSCAELGATVFNDGFH
ncbi:MAG: phosphogluconate dehydratase [Oceanospirillaceae bacterium]|nr:phosphogluconate dehydratase [Oceanospirillaceae bacterium]